MSWLQAIDNLDKELILLINGFNSPFFDYLMFYMTRTTVWIPFFLSIIFVAIKSESRRSILFFAGIILTFALADISGGLIKDAVGRLRPTRDAMLMNNLHLVNEYRGGTYGFLSNHAANSFAIFFFTTLVTRNKAIALTLLAWATLHSYTRLYLGVHYVTDVLAGSALGIFLGYLVYLPVKFCNAKCAIFKTKNSAEIEENRMFDKIEKLHAQTVVYTFSINVLMIILVSFIMLTFK